MPNRNHADPLAEVSNAQPSSAAPVRTYYCLSHHHGLLGATEEKTGVSPNRGDSTAIKAEVDTTTAQRDTTGATADDSSSAR
jgi:hypothetical protein